jgi:hypothetical protein
MKRRTHKKGGKGTKMTALEEWFASVQNVEQVNERINELQAQRQQLLNINNDDDTRARDLSSAIEMAIRNEDIATLDALLASHGHIKSLVTAQNMVARRRRLMEQRKQLVFHEDLKARLSTVTEYDFEKIKAIRDFIYQLHNQELQDDLFTRIETIVLSYKDKFTQELAESLHGANWLNSGTISPGMTALFRRLVNLQSLLQHPPAYPEPLWAFTVVSQNFKVSFAYHFSSDKKTNRIDKPELFFNYLINYLNSNISKVNSLFSLDDTEFDDRFSHTEFITSALVPVGEKLQQYINALRESTGENTTENDLCLLIHLIRETLTFDESIANNFYYDPFNDGLWSGLVANFDYSDLEKWLNLEIRLSHSNFTGIVDAPNVFQIDYTSVSNDELKPTVSAIKLKYLFESTTKTFQKLFISNYDNNGALQKFKLKLFSKTFLKFLEMYYQRLEDGTIAFSDLFKRTKSLLQSTKRNEGEVDITGTNGLDRLFRLYCSLKYTIQSINVWNHEFIFIELNSLYNKYSNTKTTSLFHSILEDYISLEHKVFDMILKFQGRTVDSLMKNYLNLNSWTTHHQPDPFGMSNELVPLLDNLHELCLFSSKIVTKYDYTKIKNHVSLKVADYIFTYVIKGNHFSNVGLKQLTVDFTSIWEKLQLKSNFPMYYKLVEAFKVLSITDEEITEYGTFTTISQFAKAGEFDAIREGLDLHYLKDGDLLDIMLRIH